MESTTLQAEVRTERGKGPARRLRSQGKIPAVFYGPGLDATPLAVDPKDIEKHLRGPFGRNTLFSLSYAGKTDLAMVRDVEVDPATRAPLHVDFYRVSLDRPIVVPVPLRTHGRAVGVVKGGALNVTRRVVPLQCTPDRIPALIDIDVTDVDLFGTIAVKDLNVPEGTQVMLRPELTIVIVLEDKKAAKIAAAEAEEAAAAAAAPAAGAAKPAAKPAGK